MTLFIFEVFAIVVAIGAILAVALQTRHLRRSTQGQLFVELRRLFDDEREIANNFRKGGPWHKDTDTSCHESNADLDAYLGLLEFCDTLIEDGLINQDTFMAMFSYRVDLIDGHPAIEYRLSDQCSTNWEILGNLIDRVAAHPISKPTTGLGRFLGIQPAGVQTHVSPQD